MYVKITLSLNVTTRSDAMIRVLSSIVLFTLIFQKCHSLLFTLSSAENLVSHFKSDAKYFASAETEAFNDKNEVESPFSIVPRNDEERSNFYKESLQDSSVRKKDIGKRKVPVSLHNRVIRQVYPHLTLPSAPPQNQYQPFNNNYSNYPGQNQNNVSFRPNFQPNQFPSNYPTYNPSKDSQPNNWHNYNMSSVYPYSNSTNHGYRPGEQYPGSNSQQSFIHNPWPQNSTPNTYNGQYPQYNNSLIHGSRYNTTHPVLPYNTNSIHTKYPSYNSTTNVPPYNHNVHTGYQPSSDRPYQNGPIGQYPLPNQSHGTYPPYNQNNQFNQNTSYQYPYHNQNNSGTNYNQFPGNNGYYPPKSNFSQPYPPQTNYNPTGPPPYYGNNNQGNFYNPPNNNNYYDPRRTHPGNFSYH